MFETKKEILLDAKKMGYKDYITGGQGLVSIDQAIDQAQGIQGEYKYAIEGKKSLDIVKKIDGKFDHIGSVQL